MLLKGKVGWVVIMDLTCLHQSAEQAVWVQYCAGSPGGARGPVLVAQCSAVEMTASEVDIHSP